MKKLYAFACALLYINATFAQALFNNNGGNIHVTNGGFMIVKTGASGLPGSMYNTLGTFDNQGTVVIEKDLKNDATITGSGDTIRVQGDWINNSTYTGNKPPNSYILITPNYLLM
jgi:hypothetical protein